MSKPREFRPQAGAQSRFLACPADIALYGGGAGAGKSFGMLLDAARHHAVPGFEALFLRRTTPELRGGGGLWSESHSIYPYLGATPNESRLEWYFRGGARIAMSHLEREHSVHQHQSKQYAAIYFDELTHFLRSQFWYMLSRNRSVCGVRPYIRSACNATPKSFVRTELVDWYVGADGYADPERAGAVRWFARDGDELVWGTSPGEVAAKVPGALPKSFAFIPATLDDNAILCRDDPSYRANLMLLPRVERERLLRANWNVEAQAGDYFKRSWFRVVDAPPTDVAWRIRAWDKAATEPSESNPDPDYTTGVKMSKTHAGEFFIEHVERLRKGPGGVRSAVRNTAEQDGTDVTIGLWQDPGAAGKSDVHDQVRELSGFTVRWMLASKAKEVYAGPLSSQAENGNVSIVRGAWNDAVLDVFEGFPKAKHDDDVDAATLAYHLGESEHKIVMA
jgi:predicted phage terminase large subunit-like protein